MSNESVENPNIEDTRDVLKRLRDDWQDETPPKIVRSTNEDRKYKARKTWFTVICGNLEILIEEEKFPDKLVKKIHKFNKKYQNLQFTRRLTRKSDIKAANSILDEILGKEKNRQHFELAS